MNLFNLFVDPHFHSFHLNIYCMKSSLLALCLIMFIQCVNAQVKKPPPPPPPKFKSAKDSIKATRDSTWKATLKDKQKTEGLFTIYQDTLTGAAHTVRDGFWCLEYDSCH